MFAINRSTSATITLTWLLRLRWLAIAGQLVTMMFVTVALKAELPWLPLLVVLGLSAFSNSWMSDTVIDNGPRAERRLAFMMMLDVLFLTAILYLTGGAHNPFTSFYLFHVALAAMTIATRWMWALVGLCVAAYGTLSITYVPLKIDGQEMVVHCSGYAWHLHGMAVAFVLTALCITTFVARMHKALRQREVELADAERRALRGEQFAALATLSAGVAHELGSPLGTIAVASRELEQSIEGGRFGPDALADAMLIRMEVERCRSILQRLNKQSTEGVGDAPEEIRTETLVEELKAGIDGKASSRLRLENLVPKERLYLPRAAVVQALSVLVQNACQADPTGKPVTLRIERQDESLSFLVRDLGPGLDKQALRHAGEPFFTTKPAGQGMGLGLFLVRTLAEQLGGELVLENAVHGGARATLSLPRNMVTL